MAEDTDLPLIRPFIAGNWIDGDGGVEVVCDKYDNTPVTEISTSSPAQVTMAVDAAVAAAASTRLTPAERAAILDRAAALIAERHQALEEAVAVDTGYTAPDVLKEVTRARETLLMCAEEARRLVGEMIPLSGVAGSEHRMAWTRLDPLGVVCAITPFNSPLNTVCHKIGPALAAGNAVILKPAAQTPRSADLLVRILLDAGLPPRLISTLYGPGAVLGDALTSDRRIAYYAFTGSTAVGERIHAAVGMRRTQLEMGSLASTIICADGDIFRAASAAVGAGVIRKSGQVCTSVQRLYVEESVLLDVVEQLRREVDGLVAGDPRAPATHVGPLISPRDAVRVQEWIDEAVDLGAELVTGGVRHGNVVSPTVLCQVPDQARVMREEVFGPVIVVRPFTDLDDAIAEANDTPYGLAAGIFTADIGRALDAADRLQTGSVHINETSSSRVDVMPFIGMKGSGFGGAEGPAYAVRDMSQERLISLRRP